MNEVLPVGTIIRIGESPKISPTAHGMVIEYLHPVYDDSDDVSANIIERTADWWQETVRHEYQPDTDTILRFGYKGAANDSDVARLVLKQVGDECD